MSRMTLIEKAAVDWFFARRPKGWSLESHLVDFQVNKVNPVERALAEKVAAKLTCIALGKKR